MLKFKADIKTLIFLSLATAILFVQWNADFNFILFFIAIYLAVDVAVIAHNHNHVPMWKSPVLNHVTDYWITLFYGFPAFAWTPTHNKNHHKFNNREGDYTITYRVSERNNIFTLLSYPSISSYFQQHPIMLHLRDLWANKRPKFFIAIFQYVALGLFIGIALWLDWRKALLYIIIPQQFALYTVMVFNYIQHVHADEESEFNHSRNFVSRFTNFMMFNNGLHTVHHHRASTHWSQLPAAHAKMAPHIAPHLNESTIWGYLFKAYIIAPFSRKYRTISMRLMRKAKNKEIKLPETKLSETKLTVEVN
ncbi:MAG: fatty acid desaturase [Bacteroidia bacterium]|nr:fatty acid desaturase [Bacteroidia bacterium]